MAINKDHLRTIIEISLCEIGENYAAENAVELLMMTAAHESLLGYYLYQDDGDREIEDHLALGIYGMEKRTHDDVQRVVIANNSKFDFMPFDNARRLIFDLKYATQMCRIHFTRFSDPIPNKDNILGLASYYKKFWNTEVGKAKTSDVVYNYKNLVLDSLRKCEMCGTRKENVTRSRHLGMWVCPSCDQTTSVPW
jgi:hypothetical protein